MKLAPFIGVRKRMVYTYIILQTHIQRATIDKKNSVTAVKFPTLFPHSWATYVIICMSNWHLLLDRWSFIFIIYYLCSCFWNNYVWRFVIFLLYNIIFIFWVIGQWLQLCNLMHVIVMQWFQSSRWEGAL